MLVNAVTTSAVAEELTSAVTMETGSINEYMEAMLVRNVASLVSNTVSTLLDARDIAILRFSSNHLSKRISRYA